MKLHQEVLPRFFALALLAATPAVLAQINIGSDGHDGEFNPTASIEVDMADHPDGIYHYTSVNIPSAVEVRFKPNARNTPVIWLVQRAVRIDGRVDLSGENSGGRAGTRGGPGGYAGGDAGNSSNAPRNGRGPGGGVAAACSLTGGNAAHATLGYVYPGDLHPSQGPSGQVYGNSFLLPLLGGSGGAGGCEPNSNDAIGGSGGGGAILIASSTSIEVHGEVRAIGGMGSALYAGGAGSGGAIRLFAPIVSGGGSLLAHGGTVTFGNWGWRSDAGDGRVRIDALDDRFTGSVKGVFSRGFQPVLLTDPSTDSSITIASVGGVPVAASPSGVLVTPDVILGATQSSPTPVVVRCRNLPLGTPITVFIAPRTGAAVSASGQNTAGTAAESAATIVLTIPRGGGLIHASATIAN